jgi:membrane-associated phospholipid phosphatase
VYVGVHYPLDVLAGIVLGIVVALVLSRVMNFLWPSPSEPAQRRRIFSMKMGDH